MLFFSLAIILYEAVVETVGMFPILKRTAPLGLTKVKYIDSEGDKPIDDASEKHHDLTLAHYGSFTVEKKGQWQR